jgi:hypothetical protein
MGEPGRSLAHQSFASRRDLNLRGSRSGPVTTNLPRPYHIVRVVIWVAHFCGLIATTVASLLSRAHHRDTSSRSEAPL